MDVRIPDSSSGAGSLLLRRSLMALLVGGLAFLCLLVLRPFFAPMVWATILAYATWPLARSYGAASVVVALTEVMGCSSCTTDSAERGASIRALVERMNVSGSARQVADLGRDKNGNAAQHRQ